MIKTQRGDYKYISKCMYVCLYMYIVYEGGIECKRGNGSDFFTFSTTRILSVGEQIVFSNFPLVAESCNPKSKAILIYGQ